MDRDGNKIKVPMNAAQAELVADLVQQYLDFFGSREMLIPMQEHVLREFISDNRICARKMREDDHFEFVVESSKTL